MAKPAIITVSRQQVEVDIQREIDKDKTKTKTRLEAAYHVKGHAHKALGKVYAKIEAMVRKAKGHENFDDDQKKEFDRLCSNFVEPELQRVGHCQNIIAELTKAK